MPTTPPGALMEAELTSQPETWERAGALAATVPLPAPGQRVAVIGCGTSWFMAQSYAAAREAAGQGLTDAWVGSEAPLHREYDLVVALSRSGTTTEVLDALDQAPPGTRSLAILADPHTPLNEAADDVITLDFAEETSVVQTRFATTALVLLRAGLGIQPPVADARTALDLDLPAGAVEAEQLAFLGRGWTIGLAHEAALKAREACQAWTESYPAMDYRHGPVAIAAPNRLTWMFGTWPEGLEDQVRSAGAHAVSYPDLDPLAQLVLAQRVALERSRRLGLDADTPRGLTRSVILDPRR